MEKEFVPYELAVKLKTLGFDEPCFNLYHKDTHQLMYKSIDGVVMIKIDNHNKTNHCSSPTFSQAFRWFREKYNMPCKIEAYQEDLKVNAYYYFYQIQTSSHIIGFGIQHNLTYEEAELACLTKLIEIAESKSE